MILFPSGIPVTVNEHHAMRHLLVAPEQYISDALAYKITQRTAALIEEWRPILFDDDSVTELPGTTDGLVDLILARSDYRTRLQRDAASTPVVTTSTNATDMYSAIDRSGTTATLFASGIEIADRDAGVLLAYVQTLNEWVYGAVMGHINRGAKMLIRTWEPILLADESVTSLPATRDAFIATVVARDDYSPAGA